MNCQRWSAAWVLVGILLSGCASPSAPQTADLTTPPAPRLEWQRTQRKADRDAAPKATDLIIREHRFVSHSAELNLDGEDQVQRVVTGLRHSQAKIVIESSGGAKIATTAATSSVGDSSKLDGQRRQYVIQKLLSLGIPDAEERVVVESPAA